MVKSLLDFGQMPPSNRYLKSREESCGTQNLVFGYCPNCGLGQLISAMPPEAVRARFDWISYNEPEGHLDDLVKKIEEKASFSPGSRASGPTCPFESPPKTATFFGCQLRWSFALAPGLFGAG